MTARTQKLKSIVLNRQPSIEADRAELVTAVYQENEGAPTVLTRARALERVLTRMPLHIQDGELLVGRVSAHPDRVPVYPEYSVRWIADGLGRGLECTEDLDADSLSRLEQALAYWDGKTVWDFGHRFLDSEVSGALEAGAFLHSSGIDGLGRIVPGYDQVVRNGLNHVIREIDARLPRASGQDATMLEASRTAAQAVIAWSRRYAGLARQLATGETDLNRKRELEQIAEICDNVPANGARTFREGLQSVLFMHLAVQIESNGHGIGLGRLDQYLHTLFERDLVTGAIDREQAAELLQCFFIKLAEIPKLRKAGSYRMAREGGISGTMFQNLTIGGVNAAGADASNDLSRLIMEAMGGIRVVQPTISLRYSPATARQTITAAAGLISTGIGMPAWFNDSTSTHMLLEEGVPQIDVWNYSMVGCIYPTMPGQSGHDASPGVFNMAKCLEITLNNGVDPVTGNRVGLATGMANDFKTFDELLDAFHRQMTYLIGLMMRPWPGIVAAYRDLAPLPLLSCLVDDCIERGRDVCADGARYHACRLPATGNANVADSLAAIRKFVFEQRLLTLSQVLEALAHDFVGYDDVEKRLARAPKYGNDDAYVDSIARETATMFCTEVRKYSDPFGGYYIPVLGVANWHWAAGSMTGALPDGRRKGLPLADGGVSAHYGRDHKGPTSLMHSATSLDHYMTGGTLLNVKFDPSVFLEAETSEKAVSLLEGYFALGGHHCQCNVVSTAELKAAQANPQDYRHLIVRVAGYSAHFVQLSKTVQDEIIARTAHSVR